MAGLKRQAWYSLFRSGHSQQEVWDALIEDQTRDMRYRHVIFWAMLAVFLIADYTGNLGRPVVYVIEAGLAYAALHIFIDMSNRNTALHTLDFIEEALRKRGQSLFHEERE